MSTYFDTNDLFFILHILKIPHNIILLHNFFINTKIVCFVIYLNYRNIKP